MRTIRQSIQRASRIQGQTEIGTVVRVDALAKDINGVILSVSPAVVVNIHGVGGLQRVELSGNIDPKLVNVGDEISIIRSQDRYIGVALLPISAKTQAGDMSFGNSEAVEFLSTPETIGAKIAGDTVGLNWNPVEGATFYEIWRSNSDEPALSDPELIAVTANTAWFTGNGISHDDGQYYGIIARGPANIAGAMSEWVRPTFVGNYSSGLTSKNQTTNIPGSLTVTKAGSIVRKDFTSIDSPSTFVIEVSDPQGTHPTTQLFANNDILRMIDADGNSLWVSVVSASDKLTYWEYTVTKQNPSAGTNYTITAGSQVADWGASGQGFFAVSADGTFGSGTLWTLSTHAGSPWSATTPQVWANDDGQLVAGAGAVTLDVNGITIVKGTSSEKALKWADSVNGQRMFELYGDDDGTFQQGYISGLGTSNITSGEMIVRAKDYVGDRELTFKLFADTPNTRTYANLIGTSTFVGFLISGTEGVPSSLLHLKSTAPTFRMEDSTASAKSLLVTVDANLATFGEVTGGTFFTLDLANKDVKLDGDLLFTDATYDIGASGATRPRHLYLSGNAVIGGTITGTTTGNAPVGSAFVTIGTDATLTSERALTGTSNQITVTDNGAGSTVVLSTPQDIHTSATPQFARLGVGVAANATEKLEVAGNIYLNAGNVILKSGATRDILFEADAATEAIRIMATNSLSTAKGAAIQFYNASHASFPGQIYFDSGGAATAAIIFRTRTDTSAAPTERARFHASGGFTLAAGNNLAIGGATFGASATAELAMKNGTAPSGNVTDVFQMYAADITAGNAAPHFRTENGDIVKIYKGATFTQTYSTANATLNADGVTDPAAYGAGANGYSTGAMAAAVHAAVIALHADLLDVKQFINSLVDELQAKGEIG